MRPIEPQEVAVIDAMLKGRSHAWRCPIDRLCASPMNDGGMKSIVLGKDDAALKNRKFGGAIAEALYKDADGALVTIALNVDCDGDLFELDIWKVDFSPLVRFPKPSELYDIKHCGEP